MIPAKVLIKNNANSCSIIQTKGLTLEEINRAFGEKVEVEINEMSDEQAEMKLQVAQVEFSEQQGEKLA